MPRTVSIAVAQMHPRKGDYAANLRRVGELIATLAAQERPPQVVHLPETVFSGYFVEGGVSDVAVTAGTLVQDLERAYRGAFDAGGKREAPAIDVIAGFYERWRGTLYNSAAYVRLGGGAPPQLLHVHRKVFLPTYGLFDEERFVERGHDIRAFDTPWGRAAILVCEDAWHSLSGTIAALDDAEVIFVSSAAPARGIHPRDDGIPGPATVARWERLLRDMAEEHGVFVSLANLVGSEGGKVFAGCSCVVGPNGNRLVRGPTWEEAVLTLTLDLGDIVRARADTPLLADLQTVLPHLRRSLDAAEGGDRSSVRYDATVESASRGVLAAGEAGAEVTDRGTAPEEGVRVGERGERVRVRAVGHGAPVAVAAGSRAEAERAEGERADAERGGGRAQEGRRAGRRPSEEGPSGKIARPSDEVRGAPPTNHDSSSNGADHHHSDAIRIIPTPAAGRVDAGTDAGGPPSLDIDAAMVEEWLVRFIRDEMARRRFARVVVGVSGGVDSAVTAFLAQRALGADHVLGVRLPYRTSSPESLEHAQHVIDALGIGAETLDISAAVDGYLAHEPDADPTRRGNVMARVRMIALFDQSAKIRGVPLGTGNKTERLFGYFTWHADDSPPINPLGDLFKTQVWALARHLGVPDAIIDKPASADLIRGQTDERDFGISYAKADAILNWLVAGYAPPDLTVRGFDAAEVELVRRRLEGTHWKRKLPTVAMLTQTAIGESYLRPVDY